MAVGWKAETVTRLPYEGPLPPLYLFRPALYSDEELRFFLVNLGESPLVALHGDLPAGVNPIAVQRVIGRIYDLQQLQDKRDVGWVGLEAIRDSIIRYLAWSEKSREIYNRSRRSSTPIRHASMHEWDSRRRPHAQGIGADGGIVVTEILSDGSRKTFDVELIEGVSTGVVRGLNLPDDFISGAVAAEAAAVAHQTMDTIEIDDEAGILKCSICKWNCAFKPGNRNNQNLASGRMARHLKDAKKEIDRHRILWSRTFGH